MRSIAALQEAGDKVGGQPGTWVLLWPEVLHHMGELFPVVEGFLRWIVLAGGAVVVVSSPSMLHVYARTGWCVARQRTWLGKYVQTNLELSVALE